MSTSLYNKSQLSQITLPSGTTYRLQDKDLREMVFSTVYTTSVAYAKNKIVYVSDEDTLYLTNADITAAQNTSLTAFKAKASEISIAEAITTIYEELSALISGGTHYIGKTTTALTDGATTNPITIDGASVKAISGDITIYYDTTKKVDREFIFNGTSWEEFGVAGVLKALAYANTASGTYTKPTGSGSVKVDTYSLTSVDTSTGNIAYVSSITGANNTFATEGIKSVSLGGQTKVPTNAIKSATLAKNDSGVAFGTALSGTTTFAINGVTVAVNNDVLEFTNATTQRVALTTTKYGITTASADTSSVTVSTTAASTSQVSTTTKYLHFETSGTTSKTVTVGTTTDKVTVSPDTSA